MTRITRKIHLSSESAQERVASSLWGWRLLQLIRIGNRPNGAVARCIGAVSLVVLALGLASCSPSEGGSDNGTVALRVGDRILDVPRDYVAGAYAERTGYGPPMNRSAVFLVGTTPDFESRSPEEMIRSTETGSDTLTHVRIQRLTGTTPERALADILKGYVGPDAAPLAGPEGVQRFQFEQPAIGTPPVWTSDVFVDPDGSFTICSRKEGPIRSPSCESWFALPPNIVVMRYGRTWLESRLSLRITVESRIVRWSRSKEN